MIQREAAPKLKALAKSFKAIALTGPRQSGKTTLVKYLFADKPYVSLENPDTRRFATDDPRGFLAGYSEGGIFDEVQRVPALFSYLQEILDNSTEAGKFILTGSNNFLIQENIGQTLAGRVAYLHLLPLSLAELEQTDQFKHDENQLLYSGAYPSIYDPGIPPADWYPNYIRTYIERDVRQIKNITDLIVFERFVRLCAARTGQELNMSGLSLETGVDVKTIQSWVGILESSFIIFLLKPHYKNFNKTIVKRPKLYFYDTGLVCSLLGIQKDEQLYHHHIKGALFETFVVAELMKNRANKGLPTNLYYWRDKTGHEIDIIIDEAGSLYPVEIKSSKTITSHFFQNIIYWNALSKADKGLVIYAGDEEQSRSNGIKVTGWQKIKDL